MINGKLDLVPEKPSLSGTGLFLADFIAGNSAETTEHLADLQLAPH